MDISNYFVGKKFDDLSQLRDVGEDLCILAMALSKSLNCSELPLIPDLGISSPRDSTFLVNSNSTTVSTN